MGAEDGQNDWKNLGYGGPCPPIGRHRYFHKLYALDLVLPDLGTPTKSELETAMEGHVLAQADLWPETRCLHIRDASSPLRFLILA